MTDHQRTNIHGMYLNFITIRQFEPDLLLVNGDILEHILYKGPGVDPNGALGSAAEQELNLPGDQHAVYVDAVGLVELCDQVLQVVLVDGEVGLHARRDEDVLLPVVLVEAEAVEHLHVYRLLHLLDLAHARDVLVVLLRFVFLHLPLHVPHVYVPVDALAHHCEIVVRNHD